jgi:ABC-type branched-subunit amino acid transport system substrate-binding protein
MLARFLTPRARYATLALAVAVVAAACGASHGNSSPSPATGASTTAPATVTKFGTLDSPCGKGAATGATANGVTNTSITIGYGDDKGYASAPGLDKEMSDAVKAIIGWCNTQGGINGRKVVGNYYDGKVLEVTQAITQACNDKVFMLVGQGYVLDDGQETLRIKCKLSSIPGFAVSTAFAHGSGVEEPIPAAGDQVSASAAFEIAQMFPDAVKKAAVVFAEFPATRETRDKGVAAYPKAGWNFLNCEQIYNVSGESDWKPIASNMKQCGVQVVYWVGSPDPNMENLLNASRQVGFTPKAWVTDPNGYTAAFAKWNGQNGGAGNNVYVRMTGVPFELADQAPAVKEYVDLVTKEGGTTGLLGEQAMSAFLLWATGVKACGSNVTAKCVLDEVAKQKGWTGGGLHVPGDPGANTAPDCGMLLKLDGAKWVRVVPASGELFDCNPKYLVAPITTDALKAAKLNSDRIATVYGTFTP